MAVQNWNWWRLYTKVLPLLDVHRTEEELKSKSVRPREYLKLPPSSLEMHQKFPLPGHATLMRSSMESENVFSIGS